jgi:glycosyltransferase involved in cell wall biosynthesis
MNIAFYILTYNRPIVLQACIRSLYGNTSIHPDESWIIDDGSEPDMQRALLELCIQRRNINLMASGRNYGIGYSFERLYNLIYQNDDLDIACIIESDYIWRKGWLEDVCSVFEASPHTLAIAGTSHPDMVDRQKTHGTFPDIMKEIFGEDLHARDSLYVPFDLETQVGKIKVQGVSNSCGCMMLHWGRFKKVIKELEEDKVNLVGDYKRLMDRAFNKGITHDTRKNASDGYMSSIISMYGESYMTFHEIDIKKNFPFLDICDYSISEHVCGGGVNGMIAPEGTTFIHSPHWSQEYLEVNPRLKKI